jgi:extracellular factor (EF) 3-hydroxypalmitic acid methyl ester biosynthesis protein
MRGGLAYEATDTLVAHLSAQRAALPARAWQDYIEQVLLRHPIRDLLHRDPLTLRAYAKPDGCPGDAVLMDMVYFRKSGFGIVDAIGDAVFRYTIDSSAMRALRNRRLRLAALIDETIREHRDARILALGAGHLREIELVRTVGSRFAGEIVAADQDEGCLAVVQCEYADRGVRVLHAPIARLLDGRLDLGRFHLVYAAGLFEQLAQPPARMLSERMFEMLSAGGRMLIANVAPDIADAGYLESYMDWHRIYRGRRDMLALVQGIARERIAEVEFSFDGTRNIAYLLVQRQGAEKETPSRHERLKQLRAACRNEWLKKFMRRM